MVSHANRVVLGLGIAVALVAAGVVGASTQGTLFGSGAGDADATRDAFKRHVHATAGEDLAEMGAMLADAPEWEEALLSDVVRLGNVREYLALPGDATDPAVLAALTELADALRVAHGAVALDVADDATLEHIADAGRHLGVLGESLRAGTPSEDAATDVRFAAVDITSASLHVLNASADLVSVTLAETPDGHVLELTVRGVLPAASEWPLALVDVCLDPRMPGDGGVDAPPEAPECVTTSGARDMGIPVVDARRTSDATLAITLPAAYADVDTLHVRTLVHALEDRCELHVADGACADETDGDVVTLVRGV